MNYVIGLNRFLIQQPTKNSKNYLLIGVENAKPWLILLMIFQLKWSLWDQIWGQIIFRIQMYNFQHLNSKVQQNSTLLCCFNFNLTPTIGFSNKIFFYWKYFFAGILKLNSSYRLKRIISQNEFFFKNLCCELCNRSKGFQWVIK